MNLAGEQGPSLKTLEKKRAMVADAAAEGAAGPPPTPDTDAESKLAFEVSGSEALAPAIGQVEGTTLLTIT